MRRIFALALIVSFGAGCNAQPPANNAAVSVVHSDMEPVTLKASDGVTVYGRWYKAANPKALILLFHQAGSSKDEYATIAPRLAQAGYSALAIDQRSGDGLYGKNETADALGRKADYLEARPDLQAALDWARTQKLPIVLWGSSYSAALVFPLAAEHPDGIVAVLSFSPGEYFDGDPPVGPAAAKLHIPVLIASGTSKDETDEADPIFAALPKSAANVLLVPEHGVHGSSTLVAAKNPQGADANFAVVLGFLNRVVPAK